MFILATTHTMLDVVRTKTKNDPTSMVRILKKINFQSVWAPQLGVSRIWTKRNDHAPKSECADFLKYMPKNDSFEIQIKNKFDHSLVFSCLHILFPKNSFIKRIYYNISQPWALAFFYMSTSFTSPIAKHVGPCQ